MYGALESLSTAITTLYANIKERPREALTSCHSFIENWDKEFDLLTGSTKGSISPLARVHPTAIIGDDVIIMDGAEVGPYCYVKSKTVIGPNVVLGFNVEVDRLIIMSGSKVAHSACIGRSLIGSGCNLGFGFVNATANIYGRPIKYWIDRDCAKLSAASHHGAVIGDGVRAAVRVSTMPGASIMGETILEPGAIARGYIG